MSLKVKKKANINLKKNHSNFCSIRRKNKFLNCTNKKLKPKNITQSWRTKMKDWFRPNHEKNNDSLIFVDAALMSAERQINMLQMESNLAGIIY